MVERRPPWWRRSARRPGWVAPRDGGYHAVGTGAEVKPPPPPGRGAASISPMERAAAQRARDSAERLRARTSTALPPDQLAAAHEAVYELQKAIQMAAVMRTESVHLQAPDARALVRYITSLGGLPPQVAAERPKG